MGRMAGGLPHFSVSRALAVGGTERVGRQGVNYGMNRQK
jgi:hypothetical protein